MKFILFFKGKTKAQFWGSEMCLLEKNTLLGNSLKLVELFSCSIFMMLNMALRVTVIFHIFSQKREQLQDEEERKSSWVSQERQKTLDRLRTFKQVKEELLFFYKFFFRKIYFYSFQDYTILLGIFFHCSLTYSLENLQQNTVLVVANLSGHCIISTIISFCCLSRMHIMSRHLANF